MNSIDTLIVDDSALMRKVIRELLRDVRCNIVGEAENGLEALRLAYVLHPRLVVMDVFMPLLNGLDALRLFREDLPDTQVMLTSSSLDPEIRDEALRLGAVACLDKGTELSDGLRALVSHLSQAPSVIGCR